MPAPVIPAHFGTRRNRFLITARLEDGTEVLAHLPNTGRLERVMREGNRVLLRRDGKPPRRTEYTLVRAWDCGWVGLEASRAPRLLTQWLDEGHPFSSFGRVSDSQTEVAVGDHRLDLLLQSEAGHVWVEVKSGSRAQDGMALLSKTPSTRGVSHLSSLGDLVAAGKQASAALVIQRNDVDCLLVGGDADERWIDAVRSARRTGVVIAAFGCAVDETRVWIDRVLPVEWG